MKPSSQPSKDEESFPRPIRHECFLPDGRVLSYYTFEDSKSNESSHKHPHSTHQLHPILYIHGFPGCGLEGAMCAIEAKKSNCCIYAPDRPGMGYSDPLPYSEYDSPQSFINGFVRDTWGLIRDLKWKSFSIIGVSGGGIFTLALLESYLSYKFGGQNSHPSISPPPFIHLEAVSIVAGVCCTTGVQGMMKSNQDLFYLASNPGIFTRGILRLGFAIPKLMLSIFPNAVLTALTKDMPKVDEELFLQNEELKNGFIEIYNTSLRQGTDIPAYEAIAIFQNKLHFEDSLRRLCEENSDFKDFPRISLLHGLKDKNVPLSHSWYVHEELLCEASQFCSYPDYGHISLIMKKASDYIGKVAPIDSIEPTENKCSGAAT